MEALEVGDVAADVKRQDLPLAGLGHLVAVDEAVENEAARGGALTLTNDVLIGFESFDRPAEALEGVLLGIRENDLALQFANERGCVEGFSHGVLLGRCHRREHICLSAACARGPFCKRLTYVILAGGGATRRATFMGMVPFPSVPHFYFDVLDGDRVMEDPNGIDFADRETAIVEAVAG